jgi:hypothetical protein
LYVIKNAVTGGYAVTLKTSAGTGISVPNGSTMLLYCDGTNVVSGASNLSTAITGVLKGNGSTLVAATANTDFLIPALANTALTGIKTATFNSQVANATTTGAVTINWTNGQAQSQASPTGPITYTFTAPPGVCHLQLIIAAAATAQTITWPASIVWMNSVWSGVNGKAAIINFWYDGTNYYTVGTNQA